MANEFSGYVLAGGKSSRMGTDKAFLNFNGETFLERAVGSLQTVCRKRARVVINETQFGEFNRRLPGLEYVFDINAECGPVGGIHAAVKDCETEYAIILACDLPFIGAETIARLARLASDPENFSAVVPRQSDGRVQPLCAVYRRRACLPAVENLLKRNKTPSMRDFLQTVETRYVELSESTTETGEDFLFFNVNRPDDFRKLEKF